MKEPILRFVCPHPLYSDEGFDMRADAVGTFLPSEEEEEVTHVVSGNYPREDMSSETNPHLRYGCAYIRLFDGQWTTQGSRDLLSGDPYGLVVGLVNAVALAMEADQMSLLEQDYPPFPNFSYMVILMRNAHALALILGQSPMHTEREALLRDLSQAPFPTSVETLVRECQKERGWRNCLSVSFPGNMLALSLERRNELVEVEAKKLAQHLASSSPEHGVETGLRPYPLASLIADEELRRRCGDLLGAQNDYDRVIAQACLVLESRVRRAIGGGATLYGVSLMGRAFSPRDGLLRLSQVDAEQQGIMSVYQGLIAFFRNSTGHHVVDSYSQHDALCFVLWVDLLLRMVASAIEQPSAQEGDTERATLAPQ